MGTVKLINYIRFEVKNGNLKPDVSSTEKFHDDSFLRPTLPEDSFLWSIGDLDEENDSETISQSNASVATPIDQDKRIEHLEAQLREAHANMAIMREMSGRLSELDMNEFDSEAGPSSKDAQKLKQELLENDSSYFDSYSYNRESSLISATYPVLYDPANGTIRGPRVDAEGQCQDKCLP